jgi:phenylpropionate dioxygenase-like ring-hydroxylating dioxygenase large terminal subunit
MSLKNFWYIAARSSEVKSRPRAAQVFGEHMVLFRNSNGQVSALLDRCAHRNTALSTGRVRGDCIECPYHGWRYDRSGSCTAIPSLGDNAQLPGIRVKAFACMEQDGFVWVCPGETPNDAKPFSFPHLHDAGWSTFRMQTRFPASVEACLENFLDCPHTVFVHKGWFRSHDTRELRAIVRRRKNSAEVEFQGEPISDSVVSRLLFPKGRELRHTDRFLVPNISRVDYEFGPDRHFIITSQCTPVTEHETLVHTVITYRFGRVGALVRLFFEPLCRKIIRQDVDILQEHSRQIGRFGGEHFCNVETDLLGLHIRALRARWEKNELPLPETQREIRIRF